MYTRCPHCDTWFRIGAEQLAQAHGQVRCGVCTHVFNALSSLSERAEQRPHSGTTATSAEVEVPPPSPSHEPVTALSAFQASDRTSTDIAADDFNDTAAPSPVRAMKEARPSPPHDEADLPPLPANATDSGLAEPWITAEGGPSATALRREPSLGTTGVDVGTINVEDRAGAAPPVTRARRGGLATGLWGVASLLLIVTLAGQYVYFHRDELAQYPELRPWVVGFCDVLGCEVSLRKDASRISLLNRVVQSHPQHENALLIDATLVNDADFTQPYPIVELRFSGLNNQLIAARRFRPYEYLPPDTEIKPGMPPQEPVRFSLEIADPGKDAVSFQFNLL